MSRDTTGRDELVAAARRTLAHVQAGTVPLDDDVISVPSAHYHDHDRWVLEMDRVFRRMPLVLAVGHELAAPGSYRAMDAMGVPILLVRGDDGILRSFVNTCSHRGAIVVEDGCGTARRFSCPYHAWTYDTRGDLVGIRDRALFGEIDLSCHGLTPLPVFERAGLVFGGVVPGADLDLDLHLCGYGEMLDELRLAGCHLVGRQSVEGPNWKVAYDGYLDFYHLPILHKDTFGPDFGNHTITDAWGPHQRNTQPDPRMAKLASIPEDEWRTDKLLGGIWTIFPHVSIAPFDTPLGRLVMISQLFPGDSPDTSVTVQTFLADFEPDDTGRQVIEQQMAFLLHVVRDEDYYTGNRIQRAVKTGAKAEVLFGRNEGACQRFHQWVQRIVDAEDDAAFAHLFTTAERFSHP